MNKKILEYKSIRWMINNPLKGVALILCGVCTVYWLLIASDRYVSESRLIIQSTNLQRNAQFDLGGLIAGGAGGNRPDQLLLREHLRSMDMAEKLDDKLGLREHFSKNGDWFSRLWSKNASKEQFYEYYLSRVFVEFDEFAGVLVVQVQAYDAGMAHDINQALVEDGEKFMNRLGHAIAQDQVDFLEKQVQTLYEKVQSTRQALLGFQESKGLISPENAAKVVASIAGALQGQLADLQAQRSALQAYLVADHPNIVLLDQRIQALEKQIEKEQSKLVAPGGKTLNRAAEAYAQLEFQAQFALDMYKTAVIALEQGRLEATRTLKKVSVLQYPNLPEISKEPRRLYTAMVWVIVILLLTGVLSLMIAVVRDHKD